jgi:allantoicase
MRAHNHGAIMDTKDSIRVRKGLLPSPGPLASNEIDLTESATVLCSSEQLGHPIEQLLDGRSGRGATSWTSARANATEEIVIEFDAPEHIARIIFDAEELHTERTQQVTIET